MKLLHLIIFFFGFNILSAQIFVKTNEQYKFEVGINPEGYIAMFKDPITYDRNYISIISIKPFLGYYPLKNKNISVGIRAEYNIFSSNLISLPNLYGAGVYTRYIFPKRLKYKFFKRLNFFTEINYNRLNYTIDDNTPEYEIKNMKFQFSKKEKPFEHTNINIPVGAIFSVSKNFKLEIAGEYAMYIDGNNRFKPRISATYMFNDFHRIKNKKITEHKKNKKHKAKTKNKDFLNSFIVGNSLTYIPNSNINDYEVGENLYKEYTWNFNIATSLNRRFNIGMQVLNIFASGTHVPNDNFLIYGLFSQYNFLGKSMKKTRFFAELSVNRGNYCTCGHLDPYKAKNIWYAGMGLGLNLPLSFLSDNFYLDLGLYNYQIINTIKTKYNYTQYIIGINYYFGKYVKDRK